MSIIHSVKKQGLSLRGLIRIKSFSKFVRMSLLSGVNKKRGFEWV